MTEFVKVEVNGNATRRTVRQPRRPWGSYRAPLERRAAAAATMIEDHGWRPKKAAGLFGVCPTYVGLARQLSDADRWRLDHGELKLAVLWREYRRRLAERAPVSELSDSQLEKLVSAAGPGRVLAVLDKLTAPVVSEQREVVS
jgi:hypothetical protein